MINPNKRMYLSCINEGIRCGYGSRGSVIYDKQKVVRTKQELVDFFIECNIEQCLCSSSMDFPHEHTKDGQVIELCREVMR